MTIRDVFGVLLSVMLPVLAAGSDLALEPQPSRPPEAAGAETAPGAHAPWFIETVDSTGDVGQYASVSAGPPWADPIFAYHDATNHFLRSAWPSASPGGGTCGDNDNWICQTVDSAGDVGKYGAVAARPDGTTLTAYHDATHRALKARIPYPADVTVDAALEPASTGLFASAALASDGTPYIAYHFNNPGNVDALMIAYPGTGDGNCGVSDPSGYWDCYTVQIGEGVGQHASLALDDDGHFHIAYQDAGDGDLWYATSRRAVNCGPGNSWHCYAVDSAPNVVGQYASIYVDSQDHFHIAYYDDTKDVLKYAVHVGSGGNCALGQAQCHVIDAMMQGYNPLGVSIAEDPAGYPVIAYQSHYGALNLARPLAALGVPAGGGNCGPETPFSTWHCETIDPAGTWIRYRNGDYVSIAVDSAGLVTIAYYGFITPEGGNLMVAYQRFQVYLPLVMRS